MISKPTNLINAKLEEMYDSRRVGQRNVLVLYKHPSDRI